MGGGGLGFLNCGFEVLYDRDLGVGVMRFGQFRLVAKCKERNVVDMSLHNSRNVRLSGVIHTIYSKVLNTNPKNTC